MLTPIPYDATATRPSWPSLPAAVRRLVERRAGVRIVHFASAGSGFTGGFASTLVGSGGQRLFVKASNDPLIADCYRREAVINAALPLSVPAPRVLWTGEADGWVVLGFEHVSGRMPTWPSDLDAVLDLVTELDRALTPAPTGLELRPLADEESLTFWRDGTSPPGGWDRDLLVSLESDWVAASAGTAMIHCDLRPDNLLIDDAGKVWVCDWNWPCLAAPWLDLVLLLAGVHASGLGASGLGASGLGASGLGVAGLDAAGLDAAGLDAAGLGAAGLDADALLASHPVGAGAPADAVNAVLAAFAGMFVARSAEPPPSFASPWLRAHQRLYGEATLSWLASRLGLAGVAPGVAPPGVPVPPRVLPPVGL